MPLPTYDKSKRRKTYEALPKDAYVVIIKGAKIEPNKSGAGEHITIIFDIAEGKYKDFYLRQFEANTNEDKTWPYDAVFRINIPYEGCEDWLWTNYNTFFADLEDSNNGFVFDGDIKSLRNKLIGGKFHIEQSEYNGNVYDHTRLRYTCVADDVRNGKAGKLPNDKLIETGSGRSGRRGAAAPADTGFISVPDDAEEELPF